MNMDSYMKAKRDAKLPKNRTKAMTRMAYVADEITDTMQRFHAPLKTDTVEFEQFRDQQTGDLPRQFQQIIELDVAMAKIGHEFGTAFAQQIKSL